MHPVTHMTIATTSVWAGERVWRRFRRGSSRPPSDELSSAFDYRFVAFGALVPDLIDKPLKYWLVPSLPDDHTIGHTLLLPVLILAAGVLLRGDYRRFAFSLGLGALSHPLVDPVVRYPETLLWPFLGWDFPQAKSWTRGMGIWIDLMLIGLMGLAFWRIAPFRGRLWRFVQSGEHPAG